MILLRASFWLKALPDAVLDLHINGLDGYILSGDFRRR
ncbi:hypothetical protein AVDCRST_MAG92-5057 [uncultured Coleofasciculus sp.]|uniref:Uncharacterized protein n=1 Tax=uncultured Coleofasciculus sp. TaxID=1267456 RepID=A0A6J4KCJ0_9CYAN|nr:hypothetical protein AVDCRST_MAG92-5057 [uncultured Coleofasciculus sp.]